MWVHADAEKDHAFHRKIAEAGAWVEFDHIGPTQQAIDWHLECVRVMEQNNLLGRTLISQDAGYYKPSEPNGGSFKDYAGPRAACGNQGVQLKRTLAIFRTQ